VALSCPARLYSEGIRALLDDLAPTQITLLPSQLWQLLTLVDTETKDNPLESLERIICSGEAFSVALWQRIEAVLLPLLPSVEILNLYGQTESTGDAMFANLTEMSETTRVAKGFVVAVGRPIRDDIVVTTTQEDEIVLGGNLAVRYLHESPSFSSLSSTSFATGDVGFCEKGLWYVQGRVNDVEKINGVWTSPSEVEATVARVFQVHHPMAASIVDGRVYVVSEQPISGFSRQVMRDAGYEWNVIPQQVICRSLPVCNESAARKVDRRELQRLIRQATAGSPVDPVTSGESGSFEGCVLHALNLVHSRSNHIDLSRSFVELGGDSASAVALLYQLRRLGVVGSTPSITALDILRASSLQDLWDAVLGSRPLKRAKQNDDNENGVQVVDFQPKKLPLRYSSYHTAVQFRGCVDASPVVSLNRTALYVGCQGGVLQKICSETGTVVAHRQFRGWMIQADCIVTSSSVIVCLFQRHEGKGMAVAVSHDLSKTFWESQLQGHIVSTPAMVGDSHLCILTGDRIVVIVDVETGAQVYSAELPEATNARLVPLNAASENCVVAVGQNGTVMRINWTQTDATNQKLLVDVLHSIDSVAPVFKDMLCSRGSCQGIITSVNGAVCKCRFDTTAEITQLTSFPLSPAAQFGCIGWIIGSYDGFVYLWKQDRSFVKIHVGASVYAKPVALPHTREGENSFVVCTTAGDVVRVRFDKRADSLTIVESFRIAGEIWSNPVILERNRVAVGARDSRLHIIQLVA
jgi:AMP-binding enzyme